MSYGGLAYSNDVHRLAKINRFTAFGTSGDFADFQYICEMLDELEFVFIFYFLIIRTGDWVNEDNLVHGPREYMAYLSLSIDLFI